METLIIRPENDKQLKAVKAVLKALHINFTSKKEKEYDKEFVNKIQESRKRAKEGKLTTVTTQNDALWRDFSAQNFLSGYCDSEPEYTMADIIEANPKRKGK